MLTFPRLFAGTHVGHPAIRIHTAREIEFLEPTEQIGMIDGEVKTFTPTSLQVIPGAMELVVG